MCAIASGLLTGKFKKGVELANKLSGISENRGNMTQAALKWILEHDVISSVIPGFKTVSQVEDNLKAVYASPYTPEEMKKLGQFYKEQVASEIRGAY